MKIWNPDRLGRMVLSLSLIHISENFLKKHPEFEPDPEGFEAALPAFLKERAQGWMLQLQAHRDGMDGFFIARMRRKPE